MGNAFTTKTYLESKLGSSLSLLYSTLSRSISHTYFSFSLADPLKGMEHKDFLSLLSKYKFVFATENAVCEDYITEKLWRSFYVGTVPIIYGSPTIKVRQLSLPTSSLSPSLPPSLPDRKSTRLNSSHVRTFRMPSSAWKKKNLQLTSFTLIFFLIFSTLSSILSPSPSSIP